MVKLIQKSGYINSGGKASRYMQYIATREGVEVLKATDFSARRQQRIWTQPCG